MQTRQLSYRERATLCPNSTAQMLFQLMEDKQSNLCVAADITQAEDLITLAETIGDEIVLLKTHIDIVENFTQELITKLTCLAQQKNFLLFEDRKFADIGNTVHYQYGAGIYRIADWAHITNAHILPGPGIIEGLRSIGRQNNRALLLLAEMSSKGSMTDENYAQRAVELAKEFSDFVIGFIARGQITPDPQWIHATPGIHLENSGDQLGQQYLTPEIAIGRGTDLIIVGRGIYGAKDPRNTASLYRERGWNAYKKL